MYQMGKRRNRQERALHNMLPDPNEIADNEVGHRTHGATIEGCFSSRKELHDAIASAISGNKPDDLLTDWNLEGLWITLHPDHPEAAAPIA